MFDKTYNKLSDYDRLQKGNPIMERHTITVYR